MTIGTFLVGVQDRTCPDRQGKRSGTRRGGGERGLLCSETKEKKILGRRDTCLQDPSTNEMGGGPREVPEQKQYRHRVPKDGWDHEPSVYYL